MVKLLILILISTRVQSKILFVLNIIYNSSVFDPEAGPHDRILDEIERDGVIYILQGKFNFYFFRNHLANLQCFDKSIVVLDFSSVLPYDSDYLQEYSKFISLCREEDYS